MIFIGRLIKTRNPKLLPAFKGEKICFQNIPEEDKAVFTPRRKRRKKKLVA